MISKHFNQKLLCSVIAAASMGYSAPEVYAAEQRLEEVLVSARKRTEAMQDVPIAITAFSGEQLVQRGIKELQNLNEGVPNLEFSGGSETAQIFIRGIGQREGAPVVDPGVGVYLDGIYIARPDGQMLDTFDVASVQVLRGPQGTLFGKNNVGGAILVDLAKPSDEFGGYAELGLGNFDRQDAKFMLTGPLIEDKLLGRMSISSRNRDGYIDNVVTGKDSANIDRLTGVGQLTWFVNDTSTVDILAGIGTRDEEVFQSHCVASDDNAFVPWVFAIDPSFSTDTPVADNCARSEAHLKRDESIQGNSIAYESDTELFGLTYNLDLESGTFKSVTSYSRQDVRPGADDNDGFEINISGAVNGKAWGYPESYRDAKQYSQEFQFSGTALDDRMDYTVGVFAQIETIDERRFTGRGVNGFLPLSANVSPIGMPFVAASSSVFSNTSIINDKDNSTYAAFAQVTHQVTDWFELTVGGRYTVESRELDSDISVVDGATAFGLITQGVANGQLYDANQIIPPIPPNNLFLASYQTAFADFQDSVLVDNPYPLNQLTNFEDDADFDEFTPMVSFKFNATDAFAKSLGLDFANAYFTYSTGFKSGGLEAISSGLTEFDPETVTTYEIGTKLDALDYRLRLNAAVFYTDYEDIQIRNAQLRGDSDQVDVIITNAGEATIAGAELEISYQISDSLRIDAYGGYIDADIKEFDEIDRQTLEVNDRSDEDLQEVPEKTFGLSLVHETEFDWGRLTSRIDGYYRDEVYVGIDDGSWDRREDSTLDSYALGNLRVAWESPNSAWRLAGWVKNFTDEEYYEGRVGVLGLIGTVVVVKSPPRTYGIDLKYSF